MGREKDDGWRKRSDITSTLYYTAVWRRMANTKPGRRIVDSHVLARGDQIDTSLTWSLFFCLFIFGHGLVALIVMIEMKP